VSDHSGRAGGERGGDRPAQGVRGRAASNVGGSAEGVRDRAASNVRGPAWDIDGGAAVGRGPRVAAEGRRADGGEAGSVGGEGGADGGHEDEHEDDDDAGQRPTRRADPMHERLQAKTTDGRRRADPRALPTRTLEHGYDNF
jgi:hypothetical protein